MQYRKLGISDLNVSLLCLGTMTWGEQNTEAEAFTQMDMAINAGINFFDTAEMYPVPPKAETYTNTETIIGNWFNKHNNRSKVILASKVAGRSDTLQYIRDGKFCLDKKNIQQALDASLKRLKTDYIDLYQLHWPDRKTNFFGQLGFVYDEKDQSTNIEETLLALADFVKQGKIRYIGLSNETPWGVMKFLQIADKLNLPKVVSIQNPYNLLNRSYEIGLSEISHRENTGLLAYSPLAFGVLSGKYLNNQAPKNARITLFERFSRYSNQLGILATQSYVNIAKKYNLDPSQMALAYVNSRSFLTSNIIGATSLEQLKTNIESINITLSAEILDEIESIHTLYPNPCP